ncbi:MAG: NUDIX hydrolase [Planctomycetota bacterium]|jgi:ADP-ribose pyrophosphatase
MADKRIESRQTVFTGVKFTVEALKMRLPDGRRVDRELVVHPGAVVILGLLDDGRVVMIRNTRFAVGQTLWELPAGTLEPGEDPSLCAGRELIEETGYEATSIEKLCEFYATPGICTELMHAYVATGLRFVGQDLEETEQIEVCPVKMSELERMIEAGEVRDAKTLATVLRYRLVAR